MSARAAVERARSWVNAVERTMLDAPKTIEQLRAEREVALAELAQAERAEANQREKLRRLPPAEATLENLWREWCSIRFLPRSGMSPRLKSRIRKFGVELYRTMPP